MWCSPPLGLLLQYTNAQMECNIKAKDAVECNKPPTQHLLPSFLLDATFPNITTRGRHFLGRLTTPSGSSSLRVTRPLPPPRSPFHAPLHFHGGSERRTVHKFIGFIHTRVPVTVQTSWLNYRVYQACQPCNIFWVWSPTPTSPTISYSSVTFFTMQFFYPCVNYEKSSFREV